MLCHIGTHNRQVLFVIIPFIAQPICVFIIIFIAVDLPRAVGTRVYTFSAQVARGKVTGTDLGAFSASCAFVFVNHNLGVRILALGVVTPFASQMASLKEHGGADTGAVHKGRALNIKNRCRHICFQRIESTLQQHCRVKKHCLKSWGKQTDTHIACIYRKYLSLLYLFDLKFK